MPREGVGDRGRASSPRLLQASLSIKSGSAGWGVVVAPGIRCVSHQQTPLRKTSEILQGRLVWWLGGGGEFNGRGIPLCEEWFWRPPRTGCHVLEGGSFGFHLHVLLSRLVVIIFTISCTRKHILKISEQVARQNNSPW